MKSLAYFEFGSNCNCILTKIIIALFTNVTNECEDLKENPM